MRADVLVENMRAGQLERLNIGPAELHAVNPRLVIARISGYGQDEPYRDKPAFGADCAI
jgi:formyl-CoA transferase